MKRTRTVAATGVLLFLVGIATLVAFRVIGGRVDDSGVLREPFYLLPLGYLFVAAGLLAGLASGIAWFRRSRS